MCLVRGLVRTLRRRRRLGGSREHRRRSQAQILDAAHHHFSPGRRPLPPRSGSPPSAATAAVRAGGPVAEYWLSRAHPPRLRQVTVRPRARRALGSQALTTRLNPAIFAISGHGDDLLAPRCSWKKICLSFVDLPGLRDLHILGKRSGLVTSQNRDAWALSAHEPGMAMAANSQIWAHGTWSRVKRMREARAMRPDAAGDDSISAPSAALCARQRGVKRRSKGVVRVFLAQTIPRRQKPVGRLSIGSVQERSLMTMDGRPDRRRNQEWFSRAGSKLRRVNRPQRSSVRRCVPPQQARLHRLSVRERDGAQSASTARSR